MGSERMGCFTVLMAEDDADDRLLVEEAILQLGGGADLRFVEDGEELIHYLRRSGKYADPSLSPRPSLILLDLNMPKKDGRKALVELKADPQLRAIPIAIWTTSREREDRIHCRKAGAEAYVTKPENYSELLKNVKKLVTKYCCSENTADSMQV